MNEKDSARSVIINIRRPRIFIKESVICDFKKQGTKLRPREKTIRKPTDASLRNYSLPGNTPVQVKAVKKDDLLLSYKLYSKKQDTNKLKQRLGINLHQKYKIINTDLRNRLHVENPSDDVGAVTDIDDGYFDCMSVHPSTKYIPLYKSLKFEFHQRLRTRQEVGYRQDCVLNIEENYRKELQTYELSIQRYMQQVKQFDVFISEDYQASMACLQKCENLVDNVNAKVSLRENLANKQFTIQSRLIGLDYMYFMQQKYGRFLYYLSPPSWRAKHREFARSVEIEAMGFDLGSSNEEDTFNVIFEKMQSECFSGLIKPVLYFSHPDVLMALFESIEKQQLHHFAHVTHLAPRTKTLKKMINKLKSNIEQESDWVVHDINAFKQLLNYCEEREAQLQAKFMKILYGLFYETVAATDVLKLQMHLEFCYERLYAEKSTNMSLMLTAKALEKIYMEYSFKLEAVTSGKVKLAIKQCVEGEKKKIRKAHMAATELRLFDRLEHALLRAFEKGNVNEDIGNGDIPLPAVKRLSMWKPKRVVRASSQRELTEEEIEYLTLFTDWTEYDNPANYLQSLSIVDRKDSLYQ